MKSHRAAVAHVNCSTVHCTILLRLLALMVVALVPCASGRHVQGPRRLLLDCSTATCLATPPPSTLAADQMHSVLAAELSSMIYKSDEEFSNKVKSWGASDVTIFHGGGGGDVAVVLAGDNIWIVFAGSVEDIDWAANAAFLPTPLQLDGQSVSVHSGYWASVNSVWDGMLAAVKSYDPDQTKHMLITGHSLGGASAMLTALLGYYPDPQKGEMQPMLGQRTLAGVWTYGAPALGDDDFASLYDSMGVGQKTLRFENSGDVAPGILAAMPMVGRRVYLSDGTCTEGGSTIPGLSIQAHQMNEQYLPAIKACQGICSVDGLKSCTGYNHDVTADPIQDDPASVAIAATANGIGGAASVNAAVNAAADAANDVAAAAAPVVNAAVNAATDAVNAIGNAFGSLFGG